MAEATVKKERVAKKAKPKKKKKVDPDSLEGIFKKEYLKKTPYLSHY